MKNLLNIILVMLIFSVKNVYAADFFCNNSDVLYILSIVLKVVDIIKVIIPVILLVVLTIDLLKASFSGEEKEIKQAQNMAIKRVIYCVLIFLLPTIIYAVMSFVDAAGGLGYKTCINNAYNIESYNQANNNEVKEEVKEVKEEALKQEIKNEQENKEPIVVAPSQTQGENPYFRTFSLTEEQLQHLANMAYKEQGSLEGVAAEASFMANKLEIKGTRLGWSLSGDSLYDYVKNGKWWSSPSKYMKDNPKKKASKEMVEIVRKVLVEGYRTIPAYIDEHGCINCAVECKNGNPGDICSVTLNGKELSWEKIKSKSSDAYVPHESVLTARSTSVFTFYSFPAKKSDPFGYKNKSNRKKKGDCYYEYGTWKPVNCG